MDFNQMGHLVKLNIKNDIISQNDQFFYSNGTFYAYYMPISYLSFTVLQPINQPTHPLTYVRTYLNVLLTYLVAALTLGLQSRQGFARGLAKRKPKP
jgi:hypothetical protein